MLVFSLILANGDINREIYNLKAGAGEKQELKLIYKLGHQVLDAGE